MSYPSPVTEMVIWTFMCRRYIDIQILLQGDLFSSTLLAEMGLEKHQLVCKPSVHNITGKKVT